MSSLEQIDTELSEILLQLSRILDTIETNVPIEGRKDYLDNIFHSHKSIFVRLRNIVGTEGGANDLIQDDNCSDGILVERYGSLFYIANRTSTNSHERQSARSDQEQSPSNSPNRSVHLPDDSAWLHRDQSPSSATSSSTSSLQEHTRSEAGVASSNRAKETEGAQVVGFSNCRVMMSPKLHEVFSLCIANPQKFFDEINRDHNQTREGIPGAFLDIYDQDGCAELSALYRRFKLRNIYRLAVDLAYHTGDRWRRDAALQLAKEIKSRQPAPALEEKEITQRLEDYVRLGRKYNMWATGLGGPGYLLALPLDITERE